MTTTHYNLIELHTLFCSQKITTLSNETVEITLDDKHDITSIQLMIHNDNKYFSFMNNATNFSDSYWLSDNHTVTLSSTEETATEETATEETAYTIGSDHYAAVARHSDDDTIVSDNLDIDAIASFCEELDLIDAIKLMTRLAKIIEKKSKTEKKHKPEETQSTTRRVSDKNYGYLALLRTWYDSKLTPSKIVDTGLNHGYGVATIAEDMRTAKVLFLTDEKIKISQEWADYIINYWSENPNTTWQRLHYAFSKDGRKCNDLDILCNYVIDNGVTKEDVKTAIASQIASQN